MRYTFAILVASLTAAGSPPAQLSVRREHPRLLGSRAELQALARGRAEAYRRVVSVAREQQADDWAKVMSESLVCAIEGDSALGRDAIGRASVHRRKQPFATVH